MDILISILKGIGILAAVVLLFNITIYVHELGHYLAARWRGLVVDRFQVWFGKPIWKKEKDGVQYSFGWIPAGGFVALPQMASMESVEGTNREGNTKLPPVKPIDKIIVAAAGPLFSFMLALVFAVIVYFIGKPNDVLKTTTVGYVVPDMPAEKAGVKAGDQIIAINDQEVDSFQGTLNGIMENIMLSEGTQLELLVKRPGQEKPISLTTEFELTDSKWWQRKGVRVIGIFPKSESTVAQIMENSPAAQAGLKPGDTITAIDGKNLYSFAQFADHMEAKNYGTIQISVRDENGSQRELSLTPRKPKTPANANPMIGVQWKSEEIDMTIVHPTPIQQFTKSLKTMWVTITKVIAPDSSIGPQHLSGPVGIVKAQYHFLQMEHGWRRIISFMVFLNVNLGILNLLPFPVLDGGHITTSILEKLLGRPIHARLMEKVQTAFALLLIGFMLYVTSKDVGDLFQGGGSKVEEVQF